MMKAKAEKHGKSVEEMSKTSATGSFQLLMGVALSTIIMAVGSNVLAELPSTDQYGRTLLRQV